MVSPTAIPAPQPFPVPSNFTFEWPSPELAMFTFRQDRMHSPFPISPMAAWFSRRFAIGFSNGFRAYSVPMRTDVVRLNTYYYLGVNPAVPPEELPALEEAAAANLQAAAPRSWERWQNQWLPELKKGWDDWAARDLAAASDEELIAAAREGADWYERIWSIHFELLVPAMLGASLFEETYTSLFPDREPLTAYRLLQGFDSMSLEAGREMWLIARETDTTPAVKKVIAETTASELWAALGSMPEARDIRAKLEAYLAIYGRRSDNVLELASVSWTEDPSPAMANLKAYIDDHTDPRQVAAAQAEDREQYLAATRAALAGHPQSARDAFEALLEMGQAFGRIQEDHNFWIDQRGTHEMRQLCLAIGARLASRDILDSASDIFFLDMDEAIDALANGNAQAKDIVASRRDEMEHWRQVTPPPMVGMDYGPPPDNPLTRSIMRFFGGPPSEPEAPNEIRGNSGSPGKATGIARIVMSIAEGARLENGDILVAPTTAPPWTPLFATASAIVTETGGVLSHCAIVAREYGIPAVVGAPNATRLIKDGSRIEVDGDTGTVRLLE